MKTAESPGRTSPCRGTATDQQKNDAADRELAQKIRQSINGHKSLSTDAHNVKVIVRNGHLSLKQPVASE